MKNLLSKINSRLDITEFLKISELEDTAIELYKLKHKGGKKKYWKTCKEPQQSVKCYKVLT